MSVNGERTVTIDEKGLTNQVPRNISSNFILGLSHQVLGGRKQFIGSVANVKFLEDDGLRDLEQMSRSLCEPNGKIIAISSEWQTHGNVLEDDENILEICNKKQHIGLQLIPQWIGLNQLEYAINWEMEA